MRDTSTSFSPAEKKAKDTTVYDGSSECHYFKGDGVEDERGLHLEMRSKPCRCNECRSTNAICTYQNIQGTPKDFYRKDKAEVEAEREQKKKEDALAKIQQVEGVLANNSLHPLSSLTDAILKSLVFVMNIEVNRRDGQTNDKDKILPPLKADRVHYLGQAGLTNESVEARIDELRNELGEANAEQYINLPIPSMSCTKHYCTTALRSPARLLLLHGGPNTSPPRLIVVPPRLIVVLPNTG